MIKGSAVGSGELTRLHWRKSTYSGTAGNCIEVAEVDGSGIRAVRDSKNPTGPTLTCAATEWCAFTTGVSAGEFD